VIFYMFVVNCLRCCRDSKVGAGKAAQWLGGHNFPSGNQSSRKVPAVSFYLPEYLAEMSKVL